MDWLSLVLQFLPYVQQFMHVSGVAKIALDAGVPIIEAVLAGEHPGLPSIVPALEKVGAELFPKLAPALHAAAAVAVTFDPNTTKWLQGGLNTLVHPTPPLVVDGLYGPKTKAAVMDLQISHGLVLTGYAGDLEQSMIQGLLATLTTTPKVTAKK